MQVLVLSAALLAVVNALPRPAPQMGGYSPDCQDGGDDDEDDYGDGGGGGGGEYNGVYGTGDSGYAQVGVGWPRGRRRLRRRHASIFFAETNPSGFAGLQRVLQLQRLRRGQHGRLRGRARGPLGQERVVLRRGLRPVAEDAAEDAAEDYAVLRMRKCSPFRIKVSCPPVVDECQAGGDCPEITCSWDCPLPPFLVSSLDQQANRARCRQTPFRPPQRHPRLESRTLFPDVPRGGGIPSDSPVPRRILRASRLPLAPPAVWPRAV